MKAFLKLISSVLFCEAVGIAATPFTISAIPAWYAYLNKPIFSPPNWIFGPVWTMLYFMMGISLYLLWTAKNRKKAQPALIFFFIQLGLNFLWSLLFFGLHSPILGLINIVFLWLAIVATIMKSQPVSKQASYLLIPYLLWVSFASVLNFAVFILNK